MIQADIYGKTGVPEDVLTSCCLGLLRLLPDNDFIELLSLASHLDGHHIDLTRVDTVKELEFWPWLRDGGAPDAIATLESSSASCFIKIVIEVKHGASKSGYNDDKLARYYNAATRQYQNNKVLLIYLTHHRDKPIADLEATIINLPNNAYIYWLSWYAVTKWTSNKLNKIQPSTTEYRILLTINDYLSLKGYKRFNQLKIPSCGPIETGSLYTKNYTSLVKNLIFNCAPLYKRLYVTHQKLYPFSISFSPGGLLK